MFSFDIRFSLLEIEGYFLFFMEIREVVYFFCETYKDKFGFFGSFMFTESIGFYVMEFFL